MKIAENILNLLLKQSRVLQTEKGCCHLSQHECFRIHLDKITIATNNLQRLQFVLPAFPAKSPNTEKTAGTLPDLGERLSLVHLNALCQTIETFYPPGAEILICSDGRVFNDLVKVDDAIVDQYAHTIKELVEHEQLKNIKLYSLDNVFRGVKYHTMRDLLVGFYGDALDAIHHHVRTDPESQALFNGIHRFIVEDHLILLPDLSKNKLRKLCKPLTYSVIQRSNAWSRYLELTFPSAIRLSIHPQACGSKKLGIMLLKADNVWATPWHRVTLKKGNDHILIRNEDAIKLGAEAILTNGVFSHYEALHY